METTIFQFIGTSIDNMTTAFVIPASTALMVPMGAIALTLSTLYLMGMAIGMCIGAIQAPMGKFLIHCAKVWAISFIALTAAGYAELVIDTFRGLQEGMLNIVSGGAGGTTYDVLDGVLAKGVEIAVLCQDNAREAGWNFGDVLVWTIAVIVVLVGTCAIALAGGAAIILSQLMLAMLITIGPFFIVMLLLPWTARFMESWFSQMMNYTLVIIVVSVVMSFSVALFGTFLTETDMTGGGLVNPMMVIGEIAILSIFLTYAVYMSMGTAAGLAGGLSMQAITLAQMGANYGTFKSLINPTSIRRDTQSGMATRDTMTGHFAAGNTIFNPRYLQAARRNFGRHWGGRTGGGARRGR